MSIMRSVCAAALLAAAAGSAHAGVVNTVVDTTAGGGTVDGAVNSGEYVGTVSGGGNGFGGPVGGATMSVDSSAAGIQLAFSGLGDFSGNSIRIYFDTRAGGFTELSSAAGFNDTTDFGRGRLSRPASNGLTLPFAADYGLIVSPAFGGFQAMFELATGGENSLIFSGGTTNSAIGENPTLGTIELNIPFATLGISAGATVDFIVVYANNNDPGSAFMSNESFPFQFQDNPGNGPVTASDFHRLVTIPAPGACALLGVGGLIAGRRRRS